jgi:predicted Na+-dependent transporter
MKNFLARHWFFVALVLLVPTALVFPAAGDVVQRWKLVKIAIFAGFLMTGLTLKTGQITSQLANIGAVAASCLSCFVLFPCVAFLPAKFLFVSQQDYLVGVCIVATAPVTIASGTILTALARGNVPLSLLICIASNFIAVFTVPISLKLLLGADQQINLPVLKMTLSLALLVLAPTAIGQLLRIRLAGRIESCKKTFSVFSQIIVLLIIFNAVASSADRIGHLGLRIAGIFAFMLLLHCVILLLNFAIARLIKLDAPATSAFTIHTSQKTLTVTYVVWSGYFSHFSLALIPNIAHHLIQVILDVFVARWFAARADRPSPLSTTKR